MYKNKKDIAEMVLRSKFVTINAYICCISYKKEEISQIKNPTSRNWK